MSTIAIFRDGEVRREEDNSGRKQVVYLELPSGRFILLPEDRVYAALEDGPTENIGPDDSADLYLHSAPIQSTYENLGPETVNGQSTIKYKVVVNSSSGEAVSKSETLMWIDEALGMPVKSVMRSAVGTRTMELSGISLSVDKRLFEIPRDYKKMEARALRKRLR